MFDDVAGVDYAAQFAIDNQGQTLQTVICHQAAPTGNSLAAAPGRWPIASAVDHSPGTSGP